jgi:DNA polymerase-3 subunit chi
MRIDFYLNAKDPFVIACRLAAKAWQESHPCHILVHETQLAMLDTLLWQTPKDAFLPHVLWEGAELAAPLPPVTLSTGPIFPGAQVLINLMTDIIQPSTSIIRLLEVIGPSEEEKAAARQRFRHYRTLYGAPTVHDLANKHHGTIKDF